VAVQQRRPSALTWALAVVELIAAAMVARLIFFSDRTAKSGHHDEGMPGMSAAGQPAVLAAHWGALEYTALVASAAALIWWLLRRRPAPALVAALAVTVLTASPALRVLATQSHLIAMVTLELLLVVVPLLLLSARPAVPDTRVAGWGGGATVLAVGAAVLYSALLIVVHLPAVHRRGAELGAAPLWLTFAALMIGIGYWFGVLRTAGRVPVRVRRAVLIGAQEVAAFIGLLSLFGAWGAMDHDSPLGLSAAWDQRLGGVFMLATCAAVAIPMVQRIK
jgi:hypothetical protein